MIIAAFSSHLTLDDLATISPVTKPCFKWSLWSSPSVPLSSTREGRLPSVCNLVSNDLPWPFSWGTKECFVSKTYPTEFSCVLELTTKRRISAHIVMNRSCDRFRFMLWDALTIAAGRCKLPAGKYTIKNVAFDVSFKHEKGIAI